MIAPGWYPADHEGYYEGWWTGRDWSGHYRYAYSKRPLRPKGPPVLLQVLFWVVAAPFVFAWGIVTRGRS